MRPQPRGHPVEALQFQRAQLGRLREGCLTERREFSTDVSMCGVHVHPELSGDLAVRAATLPQLEREDAPLGDRLDLPASAAAG